nr:uncharacterized protein LOC113827087 [Penaeus vannamei]
MRSLQEIHIESASVMPLAFYDLKNVQTVRITSMPQETVRAQSFSFDSPTLKEVLLFNDAHGGRDRLSRARTKVSQRDLASESSNPRRSPRKCTSAWSRRRHLGYTCIRLRLPPGLAALVSVGEAGPSAASHSSRPGEHPESSDYSGCL